MSMWRWRLSRAIGWLSRTASWDASRATGKFNSVHLGNACGYHEADHEILITENDGVRFRITSPFTQKKMNKKMKYREKRLKNSVGTEMAHEKQ